MHIEVARHVVEALKGEAQSAHPHECCGLLLGEGECITDHVATKNVHPTPESHFEIDPQALIDAHRVAREGGPQVCGYYHSHPAGAAVPSATDRAMASGDGRIWAIIAHGQVRFWQDNARGFDALSYEVVGD